MVKRFIKADITTPPMAPRINYPGPWYKNAEKIMVRAYDDENRFCYAELYDEKLFQQLMATGRVTELTDVEMSNAIVRFHPPSPEAEVTLMGKGKAHKTAIENLLKSKGITYRIEEQ